VFILVRYGQVSLSTGKALVKAHTFDKGYISNPPEPLR